VQVRADARLSRASRLLRTMGLRQLPVMPAGPVPVVGMLTRHELTQDRMALLLHGIGTTRMLSGSWLIQPKRLRWLGT
jgi:predicted transcriptional regulator